ncbi:MAG TPA: hypothetical protein VLA16_14085 [Ideonella sp.]|nr:hypothetical protein [Ideonella sp.]
MTPTETGATPAPSVAGVADVAEAVGQVEVGAAAAEWPEPLLDAPPEADAWEADATQADAIGERIAQVAAALRAGLTPLLEALAGAPPRPVGLTRGLGLDKTLASRLVQATKAGSDTEFLHIVPSPTGLRMLLDKAQGRPEAAPLLPRASATIDAFQALLDSLPGGRQALDARIGETSVSVREKREHMARQASFKGQSFLFGHYCETLTTALFVLPSATPGRVDVIEIHRRIGLRRITPSTPLPLLSVSPAADDGSPPDPDAPCMASVAGDPHARRSDDFLIAEASSSPLPKLTVEQEGGMATFLIGAGGPLMTPARLTTAFCVLRADTVAQTGPYNLLRNYMLHSPCRTLVRDVFLAEGLWPDARPLVGFYLPSPSGAPMAQFDPAKPHYRQVNLSTHIEQLPPGAAAFGLPDVPDQREAIERVLARAGIAGAGFRGWRCRMAYPVPLIEMRLAFRFAGVAV